MNNNIKEMLEKHGTKKEEDGEQLAHYVTLEGNEIKRELDKMSEELTSANIADYSITRSTTMAEGDKDTRRTIKKHQKLLTDLGVKYSLIEPLINVSKKKYYEEQAELQDNGVPKIDIEKED